jgi:hypothetical protein
MFTSPQWLKGGLVVKKQSAHLASIGATVLITLACWNPAHPLLAQRFLPPYEKNILERRFNSRIDLGTQDTSLEYLGRWGWGMCRGVATMGDYVLTGSGPAILLLDVTDKRHAVAVWETLATPMAASAQVGEFAIQDSIGFAFAGADLVIVDLRNPAVPFIIGRLYLGPAMVSFIAENSLVFVQKQGVVFCVDVSNPSSPFVRSTVPSGIRWGTMAICGHNLYMGDKAGSVAEYMDVSNPDSIRMIQLYSLPGIINAIYAGDSLLLLGYMNQLMIYSTTTPESPALLSSIDMPAMVVSSISLRGNTAFVGTDSGKIVSVDISDRRYPVIRGVYSPPVQPSSSPGYFAVRDSALFCSYFHSMTIFSVADPTSISLLSSFPTGYETNKVFVRNGLAYVTSGLAGLWIVDVSDPTHPRRIGNLRTESYMYDLVVDSTIAYVSVNDPRGFLNEEPWNGILAIDISQPNSLEILGSLVMRNPFAISKSGGLLFVTRADRIGSPPDTTLTILDVSDPSNMRPVGGFVGGYNSYEIASRDSVAFLASGYGLKIVDCHDPAYPQLLSTILPSAFGVSLSGQRAYVFSRRPGLPLGKDSVFVIDISDLSVPFILGAVGRPPMSSAWPERLESVCAENVVFWAGGGEIGVCDVANPAQPRIVFVGLLADPVGVHAVGDTIFVADRGEGVWVFRYASEPSSVASEENPIVGSIRLFPNYPNPFNASTQLKFAIDMRQHVRIDVFNLLGQRISTLLDGMVEAGEHAIEFNGANLSSGVYFYKLFSENASIVGRMVLLK